MRLKNKSGQRWKITNKYMLPGTRSRSEGTEAHGQLLRASDCVLCPGFIFESRGSPGALHPRGGHWLGCEFPGLLRALHQKLGAGLGVGQAQQGPRNLPFRPFGVPDACSRFRIAAFKASGQVQDGGSNQRTVDSPMVKLIVPPWDREGGSLATSSHPGGLPCSACVPLVV